MNEKKGSRLTFRLCWMQKLSLAPFPSIINQVSTNSIAIKPPIIMQWCFHSGAMIAPTIMYCVECQITAESIFPPSAFSSFQTALYDGISGRLSHGICNPILHGPDSSNLSYLVPPVPFSGAFLRRNLLFSRRDGIAFSSLTGIAGGLLTRFNYFSQSQ